MIKLDDALQNVFFLGLDTSPFIYFVERNPKYLDLMREIFKRLTDNEFHSCSSVITLTEVLVQPIRQNNLIIAHNYRDLLFNGTNFQLISLTAAIAETAAELRAKYNLRTPDALQIATALENNCDVFLCNDNGLKKVTELKILILDELEL
ncbi:MAG: type II toxin-antitoxin system VapC family toxin [Pyrinomonadaceae bacterium]|jgi:predicted nucleic acid-binding protein|nr:type II toxin-antitoxin system VapC family toxin [Pyrinomonadaceae bacterium]